VEYTFPLGIDALDCAVHANKLLFMKFVVKLVSSAQVSMRIYISTKTKITTSRILEKCTATTQVEVSLARLLKFDMLDALLDTPSQLLLNASSLHTDIANGNVNNLNIHLQVATPLTFVLRIDPRALAVSGYARYEIKVLTILTMYFVSNVKKDSMLNLLRSGTAFSYYTDGSIKPGNDLLRICPLHRIAGVCGCVARFEVQSGLYDVDTTPILAISPDPCVDSLNAYGLHSAAEGIRPLPFNHSWNFFFFLNLRVFIKE